MSARVRRSTTTAYRTIAGLLGLLLVAGVLGLATPTAARADSAPADPADPATPVTVTADALPTVQIGKAADGRDGVAWAQVVVGDTVYVAGRFTTARPAGAAPGTQEVPRRNLLAYDIRTGQLVTSFAPDLNGQALAIAASPDGTRVYVGGDFTVANGQPRNRVAAYDTRTGALVPDWRPSVSGQVRAIAASADAVYLGGTITAVGSASRTRLAAVSPTNGALLPWAPVPDVGPTDRNVLPVWQDEANAIPRRDASGNVVYDPKNRQTSNDVQALVLAGGSVIVAGRFDGLNGVKSTGIGALDPDSGVTRPFEVNQLVTNQGVNSAVWSLSTDGRAVYGTAYDYYGPGNLESAFAAEATGGRLLWASTCRGDTYSSFPLGGALYTASHAHQCGNIGGWAEYNPKQFRHAAAFSTAATGTNGPFTWQNANFVRRPAPSLLSWWPILAVGSATGQNQAAWSVTGNDRYVVYAGEFPRVNSTSQQGLVRFALPGTAPSRMAPTGGGLTPTVTSPAPGTARVVWQESHDPDNEVLTYRVHRDNGTTPVYEVTTGQSWWDRDRLSFTDRGLTAGTHTYRVTVTDPQGNRNTGPWTPVTVAAGNTPARPYVQVVRADGAESLWSLGERSGASLDQAGGYDLAVGTGVARGQAGALTGDTDTAAQLNGTSSGLAASTVQVPAPPVFSLEAWVNTRTTSGGIVVEFGNRSSGIAPSHDRLVYFDRAGRLHFGVWQNAKTVVTSPRAYNDGRWHHVVATFRAGSMALHVDGAQVAARSDVVTGEPGHGWWRIGGGYSWEVEAESWYSGRVDEVAVYPTVLSADRVAEHFRAGSTGTVGNLSPTAAFTHGVSDLTATLDGSTSADPDGTVASWAWDLGDGTTATGPTVTHAYATAGTYTVTLRTTDDDGAVGTVSRQVTVTAPPPNQAPTAAFTDAVSGLVVGVDGTGSADRDGTVAAYAWDFGDGATGTGARASHTYATAGTYPVRLTVTDDDGATGTVTRDVTVAPRTGGGVVAEDAFERTVTGGLGTADVGGPWTASVGAARQSVAGGAATLTLPTAGATTAAHLGEVAQVAADVRTSFTLSSAPTGAGTYVYVTGRSVGLREEYRVRVRVMADGRVGLALSRLTGGTETFPGGEVVVPGVTWTAGSTVSVRVQVSGVGSTEVTGTVWTGNTEPAPQLTRTDTTAVLQAPGGLGLAVHRPSSSTAATTVRFASFTAGTRSAVEQPPANAAPTAALTAAVTDLSVRVDGSASSDADGTVAAHRWDFGDGTTAQGPTASHTYRQPGTYPVTLTVTDDDGATHAVTEQVTVSAPQEQPPSGPRPLAQDGFDRPVSGGLGVAEVGGAWTVAVGGTRQSVTGSAAELALPLAGANTGSYLGEVSTTAAEVTTSFTLDTSPTGTGTFVYVTGRRVAAGQEYRVRVRVMADGRVGLALSRLTGGTETFPGGEVVVPGLTWTPGTVLGVRVVTAGVGSTEVRATVWAEGQAEPAAPQLVRTDTTAALQAPGGVGLGAHRPSSSTAATAVRFPGITVTPVG
ncbi:PKD repeat protein [Geodermatophilus bullaregiensis]|uniref:PKD domain-containing protein n=1 Tax=Geodermatophilus bullaregiensis TaxID=1564160 RepID=UPI0027DD0F6C|nr:PKD domain-containing protein [Geodermatophilus bullaregiensis]MBM7807383.1 PKD repeat protein [Geodermatophilus bullaregiensis]